jgi:hypothetical protein
MHHKTVVTLREHDLTSPDVFERTAFDLNHVARPKGGEHALAEHAQTHSSAEASAENQSLRHQS